MGRLWGPLRRWDGAEGREEPHRVGLGGDALGGEMDSYLEEVLALSEQLDDMSTSDPEVPLPVAWPPDHSLPLPTGGMDLEPGCSR